MCKIKLDLDYFRKNIPADQLESNHKTCLFATDCKMIKAFKGQPNSYNFYSRLNRSCFTVEIDDRGRIKRISNN
jgi:hypothetical protein